MMKNAFYFILKALFVLKIFQFLSRHFGHLENGFIRKIMLISKIITSKPGKLTNALYMLFNISRSKRNQTINFGQLIEHSMTNIFLDKSYTKCDGETIPRPFSKLSISLDL